MERKRNLATLQSGAAIKGVLLIVFFALALTGCHSDMKKLPIDRSDSATQTVRDAHVRRSESGQLQLELDAPMIRKYDKPRPKTVYSSNACQRVHLRLYNSNHTMKTRIEAGWAVSFDDRDIMEAHDSVVVIDYGNGDTIYLKELIWDSGEDRIYSEHLVRAKNGNRLTEGDGFTSDEKMENMQIIHQRGVIEFND